MRKRIRIKIELLLSEIEDRKQELRNCYSDYWWDRFNCDPQCDCFELIATDGTVDKLYKKIEFWLNQANLSEYRRF